jgi:hypothetical protein
MNISLRGRFLQSDFSDKTNIYSNLNEGEENEPKLQNIPFISENQTGPASKNCSV